MYRVYVSEHPVENEQACYVCDEAPTYSAVAIETGNEEKPVVVQRFVNFTAKNGYDSNRPKIVPIERLIGISVVD